MKNLELDPKKIEQKSMEIITEILGDKVLDETQAPIIKRCIHTSADFSYADNLYFSENSVEKLRDVMKNGCIIVTDTNMALSGINKTAMKKLGIEAHCYIADEEVAKRAKETGVTRAIMAVDKASESEKPVIFAVGNAPTALIRLYELIEKGYTPAGIIGVPVGFVNVVESKEMIIEKADKVPMIVAKGRKGGSNIAAAIINALMYGIVERE